MSAVESEIAATAGSPVKKVATATSEPTKENGHAGINGDAPSPPKTEEKYVGIFIREICIHIMVFDTILRLFIVYCCT